jgi:hypothetical protein
VTIISARDVDPLKVLQLADPRTAMTAGHADVGTAIAVPISRPIRACAGAYWAISLGGWESSIVIDRRLACQGSAPQVRRRFRFSFVRNALIVGKLANPAGFWRRASAGERPADAIRWCRSGSLVFEQHLRRTTLTSQALRWRAVFIDRHPLR